jgi:hypothetical protein
VLVMVDHIAFLPYGKATIARLWSIRLWNNLCSCVWGVYS